MIVQPPRLADDLLATLRQTGDVMSTGELAERMAKRITRWRGRDEMSAPSCDDLRPYLHQLVRAGLIEQLPRRGQFRMSFWHAVPPIAEWSS